MKCTAEIVRRLNDIDFYWGKGQLAELSAAKKVTLDMKPG